jgi:hypothetical protein
LRLSYRKYSPNPWSINASHPKKAGKSGDSNLMLHGFREYLRLTYFTLRQHLVSLRQHDFATNMKNATLECVVTHPTIWFLAIIFRKKPPLLPAIPAVLLPKSMVTDIMNL